MCQRVATLLGDIGPTLSHKGLAIRHWLQGKETGGDHPGNPIHSLTAVERYLEDFKRVSFLIMKGMDEIAIARACQHVSSPRAKTYQGMYREAKETKAYAYPIPRAGNG